MALLTGFSLGHRTVIDMALKQQEFGLLPCVVTFSFEGDIPASKKNFTKILTEKDKVEKLKKLGVKKVLSYDFRSFEGY